MEKKNKILIGRVDRVDFPSLDLHGIDVKVDSGAYTSSFHCHNMAVEDGVLKCQFLDPEHEKYHEKTFCFKDFTEKEVKSSNGITENRYIINAKISIFNQIYSIELSLTERCSMKYPVLLGRKFLSGKFVVDTSRKNLSFRNIKINFS